MNETMLSQNVTNGTEVNFTWDGILLATILYTITLTTIAGNLLVLLTVRMVKNLSISFHYYIINLAITDLAVAATAMSFKATHSMLGYWPFGEIVCGLWIFFDYGMTFVSVFTLILISLDRFWSVAWGVHYRQHQTKRKCVVSIIAVWLFMLVLWVPPCVLDRIRHSQPMECFWDPYLNMELVFIVATVGHHLPCIIMVSCYAYVYVFMRKRSKARATRYMSKRLVIRTTSLATITQDDLNSLEEDISCNSSTHKLNSIKESSRVKDETVFVTLTYIIVAYLICWIPFHIIFDISIAKPALVPTIIWEVGFWLTYFNSTVNPFLYAFSSEDFRRAFKKVLGINAVQCQCCTKGNNNA